MNYIIEDIAIPHLENAESFMDFLTPQHYNEFIEELTALQPEDRQDNFRQGMQEEMEYLTLLDNGIEFNLKQYNIGDGDGRVVIKMSYDYYHFENVLSEDWADLNEVKRVYAWASNLTIEEVEKMKQGH